MPEAQIHIVVVCTMCKHAYKEGIFEYCPHCGHPTGYKKPVVKETTKKKHKSRGS